MVWTTSAMWWDIHQGICCHSWYPEDVWDLSSENNSSKIIVLTFAKLFFFLFDSNSSRKWYHWFSQKHSMSSTTLDVTTTCSTGLTHNAAVETVITERSTYSPSGPLSKQQVDQVSTTKEQRCSGCELTHPPQWACSWRRCCQCWWPHRRRYPDPLGRDCWI